MILETADVSLQVKFDRVPIDPEDELRREYVCYLYEGGKLIAWDNAVCSMKDNFCKAVGRKLAFARALLNSHLGKEERSKVWDEYLKKFPPK